MRLDEIIASEPCGIERQALVQALAAVEPEARELNADDFEQAAMRIAAFARAVPGLGVREAEALEHEVMLLAHLRPQRDLRVDATDPVAVIGLRAYMRALGVWRGIPWRDNMRLQAAISDLARDIAERGLGHVSVHVAARTVTVEATLVSPNGTRLQFTERRLAGIRGLSPQLTVRSTHEGEVLHAVIAS